MGGKATLILITGFSLTYLIFGIGLLNISNKFTDNMVEDMHEKKALDLAVSATNVIVSHYWQQTDSIKDITSSIAFFDSVPFNDGIVSATVEPDPSGDDLYKITTLGHYNSGDSIYSKTVVVLYGPQLITEMASYCTYPGNIWWTGSDVVKGGIYSRDAIPVYNHPTFQDYVYSKASDFKYYGGVKADHYPILDPTKLNFNYTIEKPTNVMSDLSAEATAAGWNLYGSNSSWYDPPQDTMFIELKGTTMDVKFSEFDTPTNYDISTKVPNGIIYASNYVVRLKGELDGKLNIVCNGDLAAGKGKILLDDDIVYKDDPRSTASDDLLGLVANGLIEVADTPPNQSDININAAIFSNYSGLTAENATTKPDAGTINFLGSVIEYKRMEVGSFDPATGTLWGYGRNYEYDTRLRHFSPPGFPQLSGFHILTWYEGDIAK